MILGNGPSCEDVVEEVFVGLWLSPEKFDPERCSLLGFLRMVAKNRSIDALRAETRRKGREVYDFESFQAPTASIGSSMLETETADALQRALGALPPSERQAIILAFFDEMTYSAVALHLDVAEGTVKSRIRSGLRRLSEDHVVQLQYADRRTYVAIIRTHLALCIFLVSADDGYVGRGCRKLPEDCSRRAFGTLRH
jgi:RNA polymerase sigma factor (sigma-70 family)